MNKNLLWTILKYSLGFALLAWVVWTNWYPTDDSPGLEGAFQRNLSLAPLAVAIALCIVSLLLTFYRWHLLVLAQDLPFAVSDAMRLGLIGFAMSNFLPTSVGGDIIKAAFVAREQNRRTIAVATVIFDRIIGLCGLFWLVAVVGVFFWIGGLLHNAGLVTIVLGAWALTGGSILFWVLLGVVPQRWIEPLGEKLARIPKVGGSLGEFWRAVWIYRTRGRSIWLALVLAFLGHVGFVLTFYFAAVAICPENSVPHLQTHFLIVPVGMLIQAGFPAPGGVGGGEFAFGKLYELVGSTFAAGVLAMLMMRLISWGLGAVGYFVYLRLRPTLLGIEPSPVREVVPKQNLAPVEV